MDKIHNPQPINQIGDGHLRHFANHLYQWLITSQTIDDKVDFPASRAKAILRAASVVDQPLLADFERLLQDDTAVRIILADLLHSTGLGQVETVTQWSGMPNLEKEIALNWHGLILAAFAWKNEYPLTKLDPAVPPTPYSPAGQVLQRTGHFIRRQVQRTATERGKLGRQLAYQPETAGTPKSSDDSPIPAEPPHFRTPIPVRYPEMARETLQVDPDEPAEPVTAIPRTDPITITPDDIPPTTPMPTRMPPIRIERRQAPPHSQVAQHGATRSLAHAVRQKFGRSRERLVTTKLRVMAQEMPGGPGLAGLQVKVRCQGIHSFVAGTTNGDGRFLCELPVRIRSGLTYDVEVTWPRDMGGDVEVKSITLNADRKAFTLPFYRRQNL